MTTTSSKLEDRTKTHERHDVRAAAEAFITCDSIRACNERSGKDHEQIPSQKREAAISDAIIVDT